MAKVVVCETLVRPREIPIPSSIGDGTYYIVIAKTIFNDSVCDCKGFQFRGTCKHVTMVDEAICQFHRLPSEIELETGAARGLCPDCGEELLLYELEPEFD